MITPYFLVSLLLLIVIAAAACYFSKRPVIYLSILLLVALFIPVSYGAISSLMGKAKPVALEWARGNVKEALILGSVARENVGLFLFMSMPGEVEPMTFKVPWSKEAAEELQKAEQESRKNGQKGALMKLPFESTLDRREPMFYPLPQVALPQKEAPEEKPQVFERST